MQLSFCAGFGIKTSVASPVLRMLSHSASLPFFLLAVIFYVCLQLFFCSLSRDCSAKCSFHGHCDKDENCTCDKGWSGSTCNIPTCIEECIHGYCDNTTWLCVCDPGVYGKMLCKTYFKLFMYPTYL